MESIPEVYVDGGSENDNAEVNELIISKKITRTFAQLEIDFTNAMIEALFWRLKNAYLYFLSLTDLKVLVQGVEFYMNESNNMIPHSALKGATPFEAVSGTWPERNILQITDQTRAAKTARMAANRAAYCQICPT